MKLLDPHLADLTPAHVALFWRYQIVRTLVDFGAAICFVIGSVCFFSSSSSLTLAADWLFLVGSVLFAVKPTIDVVRSLHLKSLAATSHGAG